MDITEHTRDTITQALRRLKWSQTELAERLGINKSQVTKILNGTRKRLSDDEVLNLQKLLGVELVVFGEARPLPELAKQLGERMRSSDDLTEIAARLVNIADKSLYHSLPYLPTKDLVAFGNEIMRASHEDPDKPGKVGKIAVIWLSDRLKELETKAR